ncbi:MAG: DNA-binding response regulator [Cyanobium sp.]
MDLTPHLPLMRTNHRRAWDLFEGKRLVLGLGSRALIAAIASERPPEQIVGVATTAPSIFRLVERKQPDLVVVSDPLEAGCGLSLVLKLKERWPELPIFLIVMGDSRSERVQTCVKALRDRVAVVSDRMLGSGTGMAALQSLRVGASFLDSSIPMPPPPARTGLSQREKDVMRWLVAGQRNGEIANRLQISPETVKSHLANVYGKLNVRNRQQAALRVMQLGLLDT